MHDPRCYLMTFTKVYEAQGPPKFVYEYLNFRNRDHFDSFSHDLLSGEYTFDVEESCSGIEDLRFFKIY